MNNLKKHVVLQHTRRVCLFGFMPKCYNKLYYCTYPQRMQLTALSKAHALSLDKAFGPLWFLPLLSPYNSPKGLPLALSLHTHPGMLAEGKAVVVFAFDFTGRTHLWPFPKLLSTYKYDKYELLLENHDGRGSNKLIQKNNTKAPALSLDAGPASNIIRKLIKKKKNKNSAPLKLRLPPAPLFSLAPLPPATFNNDKKSMIRLKKPRTEKLTVSLRTKEKNKKFLSFDKDKKGLNNNNTLSSPMGNDINLNFILAGDAERKRPIFTSKLKKGRLRSPLKLIFTPSSFYTTHEGNAEAGFAPVSRPSRFSGVRPVKSKAKTTTALPSASIPGWVCSERAKGSPFAFGPHFNVGRPLFLRATSATSLDAGTQPRGQRDEQTTRLFQSSYSKITEINLITISLASANRIRQWAEKTLPNGKVVGEVINPETVHYKTLKPIKGGLFCERIFGPLKDHECACGKKFDIKNYLKTAPIFNESPLSLRSKISTEGSTVFDLSKNNNLPAGLEGHSPPGYQKDLINSPYFKEKDLNQGQKRYFCRVCDVEYTYSILRRTQLGYIQLASPTTHVWFVKGIPSYISILLDMKKKNLQNVTYNTEILTLEHQMKFGQRFLPSSPKSIFEAWQKIMQKQYPEKYGQKTAKIRAKNTAASGFDLKKKFLPNNNTKVDINLRRSPIPFSPLVKTKGYGEGPGPKAKTKGLPASKDKASWFLPLLKIRANNGRSLTLLQQKDVANNKKLITCGSGFTFMFLRPSSKPSIPERECRSSPLKMTFEITTNIWLGKGKQNKLRAKISSGVKGIKKRKHTRRVCSPPPGKESSAPWLLPVCFWSPSYLHFFKKSGSILGQKISMYTFLQKTGRTPVSLDKLWPFRCIPIRVCLPRAKLLSTYKYELLLELGLKGIRKKEQENYPGMLDEKKRLYKQNKKSFFSFSSNCFSPWGKTQTALALCQSLQVKNLSPRSLPPASLLFLINKGAKKTKGALVEQNRFCRPWVKTHTAKVINFYFPFGPLFLRATSASLYSFSSFSSSKSSGLFNKYVLNSFGKGQSLSKDTGVTRATRFLSFTLALPYISLNKKEVIKYKSKTRTANYIPSQGRKNVDNLKISEHKNKNRAPAFLYLPSSNLSIFRPWALAQLWHKAKKAYPSSPMGNGMPSLERPYLKPMPYLQISKKFLVKRKLIISLREVKRGLLNVLLTLAKAKAVVYTKVYFSRSPIPYGEGPGKYYTSGKEASLLLPYCYPNLIVNNKLSTFKKFSLPLDIMLKPMVEVVLSDLGRKKLQYRNNTNISSTTNIWLGKRHKKLTTDYLPKNELKFIYYTKKGWFKLFGLYFKALSPLSCQKKLGLMPKKISNTTNIWLGKGLWLSTYLYELLLPGKGKKGAQRDYLWPFRCIPIRVCLPRAKRHTRMGMLDENKKKVKSIFDRRINTFAKKQPIPLHLLFLAKDQQSLKLLPLRYKTVKKEGNTRPHCSFSPPASKDVVPMYIAHGQLFASPSPYLNTPIFIFTKALALSLDAGLPFFNFGIKPELFLKKGIVHSSEMTWRPKGASPTPLFLRSHLLSYSVRLLYKIFIKINKPAFYKKPGKRLLFLPKKISNTISTLFKAQKSNLIRPSVKQNKKIKSIIFLSAQAIYPLGLQVIYELPSLFMLPNHIFAQRDYLQYQKILRNTRMGMLDDGHEKERPKFIKRVTKSNGERPSKTDSKVVSLKNNLKQNLGKSFFSPLSTFLSQAKEKIRNRVKISTPKKGGQGNFLNKYKHPLGSLMPLSPTLGEDNEKQSTKLALMLLLKLSKVNNKLGLPPKKTSNTTLTEGNVKGKLPSVKAMALLKGHLKKQNLTLKRAKVGFPLYENDKTDTSFRVKIKRTLLATLYLNSLEVNPEVKIALGQGSNFKKGKNRLFSTKIKLILLALALPLLKTKVVKRLYACYCGNLCFMPFIRLQFLSPQEISSNINFDKASWFLPLLKIRANNGRSLTKGKGFKLRAKVYGFPSWFSWVAFGPGPKGLKYNISKGDKKKRTEKYPYGYAGQPIYNKGSSLKNQTFLALCQSYKKASLIKTVKILTRYFFFLKQRKKTVASKLYNSLLADFETLIQRTEGDAKKGDHRIYRKKSAKVYITRKKQKKQQHNLAKIIRPHFPRGSSPLKKSPSCFMGLKPILLENQGLEMLYPYYALNKAFAFGRGSNIKLPAAKDKAYNKAHKKKLWPFPLLLSTYKYDKYELLLEKKKKYSFYLFVCFTFFSYVFLLSNRQLEPEFLRLLLNNTYASLTKKKLGLKLFYNYQKSDLIRPSVKQNKKIKSIIFLSAQAIYPLGLQVMSELYHDFNGVTPMKTERSKKGMQKALRPGMPSLQLDIMLKPMVEVVISNINEKLNKGLFLLGLKPKPYKILNSMLEKYEDPSSFFLFPLSNFLPEGKKRKGGLLGNNLALGTYPQRMQLAVPLGLDQRQNKNLIVNNIYCLSHRELWAQEKDWQDFAYYYYSTTNIRDRPIPLYKHRNYDLLFSLDMNKGSKATDYFPAHINHLSLGMNINTAFSGAGLIQKLLNDFNYTELKKMDKQNRILLFEYNKYVQKLKKKMDPASKKSQNKYYKACHIRDLLIRRTKLTRKILNQILPELNIDVQNSKKLKNKTDDKVFGGQSSANIIKGYYKKELSSQTNGLNMILTLLPVLPPVLRPVLKLSGQFTISDLNRLYQRIIYRNERLKKFLKDPALSSSFEMKYAQRLLQEAVDNLIQNGKSGVVPEKDARGRLLKSLSDILKGKQGRFRQYLLGKRVDYSGRSVIVVGPRLKLHECGIPKEMALVLYSPFLIKRILNQKLADTYLSAKKLCRTNPLLVSQLLREIMKACPVLLNRAPTLHRLGFQAFQPKLVDGKAILLHPLVCPAFNADFDGDQMAVHIPITFEARAEAWKLMLARNNLLSPATGDPILLPSQDMVLGCYYLTTDCFNLLNLGVKPEKWSPASKDKAPWFLENHTGLKKGSGMFFYLINDVIINYNLGLLHVHAVIWVNFKGQVENGNTVEQPLEIRFPLTNFKLNKGTKMFSTKSFIPVISTSKRKPFLLKAMGKSKINFDQKNFLNFIEIYSKSHNFLNSKGKRTTTIIRTTPGKLLFNIIIKNAIEKHPTLLFKYNSTAGSVKNKLIRTFSRLKKLI